MAVNSEMGVIELPPVPIVSSAPGEELSVFRPGSHGETQAVTVRIDVAVNQDLRRVEGLSVSEQSFILDCVRVIRVAGCDLSITGIDDEPECNRSWSKWRHPPRPTRSSSTLWTSEASSSGVPVLLPLLVTWSLRTTNIRLALWDKCFCEGIEPLLEKVIDGSLQTLGGPVTLVISLAFGSVYAERAPALYNNQVKRVVAAIPDMQDIQHPTLMAPHMFSLYEHLMVLTQIHALAFGETEHAAQKVLKELNTRLEELESIAVRDEWIDHDTEVIWTFMPSLLNYMRKGKGKGRSRRVRADKAHEDFEDLVHQLSLWARPFQTYDSAANPDVPPLASFQDFVGWEDRAHLAELSKEVKSAIHELQHSMGLSLSKFG